MIRAKETHFVDISQPFADAIERLAIGDVIDKHYSHSTPVVG